MAESGQTLRDRIAQAITVALREGPFDPLPTVVNGITADALRATDAVLAVRDDELAEALRRAEQAEVEAADLRAELERRIDADAQTLADQTLMRELTVKDGAISLDLVPPRELAALWVHCAKGMLGDAPNYTETRVDVPKVSMEVKQAGSVDRYALTVQRVGNLTPHEARQRAEAAVARVRALAERLGVTDPGLRDEIVAALDVPADGEQRGDRND